MPKGDITRLAATAGVNEGNKPHQFQKGKSGNPGGKISLAKDLERARAIGVPPDVTAALDEWFTDAAVRMGELGADGFIAGLRAALDEATARVLPLNAPEARAMWWRMILPVAFAGPRGQKDSNWSYASQEVGVRLLGKPKETLALEGGDDRPIDWHRVPKDRREPLLAAIAELRSYIDDPAPTEH